MPEFIVRLERGGVERFLRWSTVCDAPISDGMTEEELTAATKEEFGSEGLRNLPARLECARKWGTSLLTPTSAEDACTPNRAGPRESSISIDAIWDAYVTPAAPQRSTPEPSLAEAAQEVVDLMARGWLAVKGDVERHRELFARLRAALAAEEARQRLRTDAALAWLALPGSVQYLGTCDALRRWAERETTPAQRAGRMPR